MRAITDRKTRYDAFGRRSQIDTFRFTLKSIVNNGMDRSINLIDDGAGNITAFPRLYP